MSSHAGLAARIHRALSDLDLLVPRLGTLAARSKLETDFAVVDALALNVQSLYTGLEQIFEAIAREVDDDLPSGASWHRELLDQMGSEVSERRPEVISEASRSCLHEARSFRHVVRNVYSYNLNPEMVTALARRLLDCYAQVRGELEGFASHFLESDRS